MATLRDPTLVDAIEARLAYTAPAIRTEAIRAVRMLATGHPDEEVRRAATATLAGLAETEST